MHRALFCFFPIIIEARKKRRGNMADTILEMRGIKKSFHGVKALSDVNLTVQAGQIHAIVG